MIHRNQHKVNRLFTSRISQHALLPMVQPANRNGERDNRGQFALIITQLFPERYDMGDRLVSYRVSPLLAGSQHLGAYRKQAAGRTSRALRSAVLLPLASRFCPSQEPAQGVGLSGGLGGCCQVCCGGG